MTRSADTATTQRDGAKLGGGITRANLVRALETATRAMRVTALRDMVGVSRRGVLTGFDRHHRGLVDVETSPTIGVR